MNCEGKMVKMQQPDTRQRLLDTAEKLFAHHGYHCTSLRKVTAEAKVNLAAVSYHFGSKEALLEAIFERRLHPLNEERLNRLEEIRTTAAAEGRRPTVEEALRAFVEPTLHFRDSAPGARDFMHLIGRALTEPDPAVRSIFFRLVGPLFARLFEVLCETLPDLSRNQVFWRLNFAIGAISRCTFLPEKLPEVPAGVEIEIKAESQIDMLINFLVAGMEAP